VIVKPTEAPGRPQTHGRVGTHNEAPDSAIFHLLAASLGTITTAAEPTGIASAYRTYQAWGWPVGLREDQVRLDAQSDMIGLIIPIRLAIQVAATLSAQRSSPPVVVHPAAPGHRLLVCSEPFAVALPWPPAILRVDPPLLLPPTPTPCGPLTWDAPPQPGELRLCREIDAFGALRTILKDLLFPPL
jgi:hypothetical protein